MSYNSKYKGSEVDAALDLAMTALQGKDKENLATKEDVTITEGAEVSNGVYAVTADGELIDYNIADSSCLGVALVAGEHRFMIAKNDASNDGSNYNLYYDYRRGDLSLTNYSTVDGTNIYGYLGGSSTPQLSTDFTTWTEGVLSDFNGKKNTQVIAANSSNAKDMCKVLETFNAGTNSQSNEGHNDWYVPAFGQLALMYLAKTDINAALAKIGGTAFESYFYWSSSEKDAGNAWYVYFTNGIVNNYDKDDDYRVRFVRDISTEKKIPLKDYALGLNGKIASVSDKIPTKMSDLDNDAYGVSSVGMEFALGDSSESVSTVSEWTTPTSTITQRMRACIFGNGYYVICGTNGEFAYSLDSVEWLEITPFTKDVITSIAYGGGKFLCIDSGGKIWIAYNTPIEWTQIDVTFGYILESVVYANNRFLIVGASGFVAVSNNGLTWRESKIGEVDKYGVCYGNGKYVAVGLSGSVFYSFDGLTWTDSSDASVTSSFRTISYGKGLYVLGGQGGIIRYSSDGIVWNTATSNTTQTISYIRGIVYTEGLFYAVMYTSAGKGEIWVSTDAQTWTVQYSASGRVWCVATGGDVIFASGDNGTIYRLDLDVEWLDYEPELTEGKYLWKRLYVVLTDGVKVLGENIMETNAKRLASVATSGSYDDLANKPSIPSEVTEGTVSGWGFTKNTGTYSKPSDGIPKGDLSPSVQSSLSKADSALQNVKTINGQAIEGEGDLKISGESSYPYEYPSYSTGFSLESNKYYDFGSRTVVAVSFGTPKEGVVNEYIFKFKAYSEDSELILPSSVVFPNGTPILEAGKTYEISIIDNLAVFVAF